MIKHIEYIRFYTDGNKGKYDKKVKNKDACYGRNSVNNTKNTAMRDCRGLEITISPMGIFQYKYNTNMPEDKITKYNDSFLVIDDRGVLRTQIGWQERYSLLDKDKKISMDSLMGAGFEEMDQRSEVGIDEYADEIEKHFLSIGGVIKKDEVKKCISVADVNNDKKIDLAEYAATILYADSLSGSEDVFSQPDGCVSDIGNVIINEHFSNPKYAKIVKKLLNIIMNKFNLEQEKNKFLSNKNNCIVVDD